jgi:hypothetical protein
MTTEVEGTPVRLDRKSGEHYSQQPSLSQTADLEASTTLVSRGFFHGVQSPFNRDYQQPGTVLACILVMNEVEKTHADHGRCHTRKAADF